MNHEHGAWLIDTTYVKCGICQKPISTIHHSTYEDEPGGLPYLLCG